MYCYVYCAPCWLSILTAARIYHDECWDGRKTLMTWRIRPDERLDPEYRLVRAKLQNLLEVTETSRRNFAKVRWWTYTDSNHIRRRLYALVHNNTETGANLADETYCNPGGILKEHLETPNGAAIVFVTRALTSLARDHAGRESIYTLCAPNSEWSTTFSISGKEHGCFRGSTMGAGGVIREHGGKEQ